jgi:hypothetical protein
MVAPLAKAGTNVVLGRRAALVARLACVGPAVIGLALAASACGSGSPDAGVASLGSTMTTTTTAVAAAVAPGGALVEYARCMRSHGLSSFPDPASLGASAIRELKGQIAETVGSLASSPVFQSAQRACAKYYGPPAASAPQVSPQELQKLLAVSRCMRAHGVPTFPDPNPRTGEMAPPAGTSKTSPQVLGALRACRSLGEAAGLGAPNTGP